MIRINLAKRKQAAYVGAQTKTVFKNAPTLTHMRSSIGTAGVGTLLFRLGLPMVLCGAAYFGFDYYISHQTADMQAELQQIESEKTKIEVELGRIKGFESVKLDLERNEKILHNKIDTIQRLITNRDFAFKSLIGLSQSLPREVWLSDLQETEQGFLIKGNATDVGLVSDLMTKLGQTIYFKEVSLKSTSNDPTGNRAIFELTARRE